MVPPAFVQVIPESEVDSGEIIQRPPIIPSHQPVEKALENQPIPIGISVQGARLEDRIILNFREKGRFDFNSMVMGYNPTTKNYETVIDENYHSNETFEYYIEIFPQGASKIRVPPENNAYFEIRSHKSSADIIRGILIALLIASPAIVAYIVSRVHRAHVKRTTIHQQKLRQRKRELTRQREKHYKEYLRKLSGGRGPVTPTKSGVSRPARAKKEAEPDTTPAVQLPRRETPTPDLDEKVSTLELKRELDEILSGRETRAQTGRTTPPPGQSDNRDRSAHPSSRQSTRRLPPRPDRSAEDTGSIGAKQKEKTGPIPSDAISDKSKKDSQPVKPRKTLKKTERDKLLDILGLDDL